MPTDLTPMPEFTLKEVGTTKMETPELQRPVSMLKQLQDELRVSKGIT
jgi:hypothetical protein